MNRRNTLKTLAIASAGAIGIGYWAKDLIYIKDLMSNSFFKPSEQDLITSIADTIIPKGELYGAVDLGVPVFLLGLFEKCYEKETNDNIRLQLVALDQSANEKFNTDFIDCSQQQREELLLAFSASEEAAKKEFFDLLKSQTIRGFRTSEEVMTNHYNYELMPGYFDGCVEIEEKSLS